MAPRINHFGRFFGEQLLKSTVSRVDASPETANTAAMIARPESPATNASSSSSPFNLVRRPWHVPGARRCPRHRPTLACIVTACVLIPTCFFPLPALAQLRQQPRRQGEPSSSGPTPTDQQLGTVAEQETGGGQTPPSSGSAPAKSASPAAGLTGDRQKDIADAKQLLEAARENDAISDELRGRIQDALTATLKNLERRDLAIQQAQDLTAAAESAPRRRTNAEQALRQSITIDLGDVTSTSAAEDINGLTKRLEADLATATTRGKAIHEQINQRRTESKELPQQIATLEEQLAGISPPPAQGPDINPLLAEALARQAATQQQVLEAELQLGRQKLLAYEAESPVLPLEQQQLDRLATALTEAISRVSGWASRRRHNEISSQIGDFRRLAEAAGKAADVEETLELFEQWTAFFSENQKWNSLLLKLREATDNLRNDFHETESLVDADRATGSGLSRSAGSLLKRKRVMLSRTKALLGDTAGQAAAIDDAQDVLADVDTLLDELDQQPPPTEDSPAAALWKQQHALLEAMNADFDRGLIDTLIPLGVQYEVFTRQIDDYERLIDKNVLWVRSDKPVRVSDIWGLIRLAGWLKPDRLGSVVQAFAVGVAARPILAGAVLFAAVAIIVLHRWFVLRITALGSSLSSTNAMRLRPTIQAIGYSICAALPVWLPLASISWFLGAYAAPETTEAFLADSLWVAGLVFLPLEILRQLIRPHGVAVAHFAWPSLAIQPLRHAISRTAWIGLGLVFLTSLLLAERTLHSELSPLSRIVFSVLMVFVSGLLWRLLDPNTGVTAAIVATRPNGFLARLLWLWKPLVVAMPIFLAGFSLTGYAFAATQLAVSLYQSIWIVVTAAIFQGLALRWLLVSKRRIALQQLKERSALREQAEASGTASEILHVNQLKLADIDQQTRRLIEATIAVGLAVALYWIWSPVIPALSFLDSIVLWTLHDADGSVASVVSLSNVLITFPMLLLTFVLVRNVPGLLEAALLQKLPLDNASRYAITSLTSYLVAFCGLLVAAGTLGLRWSSVQWLAAGLSVGLGFGLQEVVANFVCGLILLFEQPIRVGDVVTLDSISGVVSRIRIRATTVTTWERQEYVIPNKDLITGRVINWTLSDSVNRAELRVGVAYGTDTRRVETLLRELCLGIPEILNDPPPIITFEEFGDSTLNFMVRFYLASLDNRLTTISELHSQVHERFNAEGIEIAFPQVDVHMKSPTVAPPAIS